MVGRPNEPSVEFYDRVGRVGEAVDLLDLVASRVAFTVWIMDAAFRRGGWELLDVVAVSESDTPRSNIARRRTRSAASAAFTGPTLSPATLARYPLPWRVRIPGGSGDLGCPPC
ncbi:Imm26 family immunity protein [Actinophytocola sp.]|uniref:Imm26 family immunity protein n=1 Tax=Actinophytocola sp. TaxID=1872138 RepID=UPI0039C8871F